MRLWEAISKVTASQAVSILQEVQATQYNDMICRNHNTHCRLIPGKACVVCPGAKQCWICQMHHPRTLAPPALCGGRHASCAWCQALQLLVQKRALWYGTGATSGAE